MSPTTPLSPPPMKFAEYTPEQQEAHITKWLAQCMAPFYKTLTLAQCLPVFLAYNPTIWTDSQTPERGEFIMMQDGNFLCQDLRAKYERI